MADRINSWRDEFVGSCAALLSRRPLGAAYWLFAGGHDRHFERARPHHRDDSWAHATIGSFFPADAGILFFTDSVGRLDLSAAAVKRGWSGGRQLSHLTVVGHLNRGRSACADCHVMRGQYDAWAKSSHHSAPHLHGSRVELG